jgi:uncharacterized OB-fold protein
MHPTEPILLGRADPAGGVQALAVQHRAVAREHRTAVAQRCDSCARWQFPPMLACPVCGSSKLSWLSCGDTATVGTFVTVHTAQGTPSMSIPRRLAAVAPYTSVFAAPLAVPEVRLAALMLGPQQHHIRVGSAVGFDFSDDYGLMVNLLG